MQLHISDEPSTSRAFLAAASLDVGNILKSYIVIHDDIFRFSLRRILPVPVVFKGINYDEYFRRLFYLDETLNGIVRQLPESSDEAHELLSVVKKYCEELSQTLNCLRGVCGSLMEKAQGEGVYTWSDYQRDLKLYNAAVSKYRETGKTLNELVSK